MRWMRRPEKRLNAASVRTKGRIRTPERNGVDSLADQVEWEVVFCSEVGLVGGGRVSGVIDVRGLVEGRTKPCVKSTRKQATLDRFLNTPRGMRGYLASFFSL